MAKGDFFEVSYRTPTGIQTVGVLASTDGSKVELVEPRANETFVKVEVQRKNGEVAEQHLFAKGEVLAIKQGHKMIARANRK